MPVVATADTRRVVRLPNFSATEGNCSCGCGAGLVDALVTRLQVLTWILSRLHKGAQVQCRMSSGARCQAKNDAVPGAANFSRHLTGEAADCTFWEKTRAGWVQIPNSEVYEVARHSGMFGGVGYLKYVADKTNLVHLDIRPGGMPPVVW